jgi:hypothetical protein
MSSTTKTNPDKIKLLDQMLEDLAGDEFDEYNEAENGASADYKRYSPEEDLDTIDLLH